MTPQETKSSPRIGSGREDHDGFKVGGVSAPSEIEASCPNSPNRRGIPAIFSSYTLCTAALTASGYQARHHVRVGLLPITSVSVAVVRGAICCTSVAQVAYRVGIAAGGGGRSAAGWNRC